MGCSFCIKNKETSDAVVNDNGTLTKKVTEKEMAFWEDMQKLELVKISKFNQNKKTIEFGFSNLYIENFITFGQIMEYMVTEGNFFYFLTLFEITLAIVDFIQVIFNLKIKYGLNKSSFFFINFEKFYLMKDSEGVYSKLVYLDEKLNDAFSCPELLYKDESNLLSSFSIMEENGKSVQMLLSTINSTNLKTTMSIDLNSYFYSKCNDRYQKLRSNYSIEECEKFYTENIINFVSRFLIKKASFCNTDIEREFNNLKYILRHTLSHYFKTPEKINLQNLKIILTNFYVNNTEFGILRENIEEKLTSNGLTNNKFIMDKIISFKQAGICINYGECDIISEIIPKQFHKITFINDNLNNILNLNSINNNSHQNTSSNHPCICLYCVSSVLLKKAPDGRSSFITLKQFEQEIQKKHSFIDLIQFLKYFLPYFENEEKTKYNLNEKSYDIYVYKKNKHSITFEYIPDSDEKDEQIHSEVLNLDFYVKNNLNNKKKCGDNQNISILPNSK